METELLTEDQALARFRGLVESYRTKGEAAEHLGIPSPNVSDMLRGKRPLSPAALAAIKLERISMYRHKETADAN